VASREFSKYSRTCEIPKSQKARRFRQKHGKLRNLRKHGGSVRNTGNCKMWNSHPAVIRESRKFPAGPGKTRNLRKHGGSARNRQLRCHYDRAFLLRGPLEGVPRKTRFSRSPLDRRVHDFGHFWGFLGGIRPLKHPENSRFWPKKAHFWPRGARKTGPGGAKKGPKMGSRGTPFWPKTGISGAPGHPPRISQKRPKSCTNASLRGSFKNTYFSGNPSKRVSVTNSPAEVTRDL